MFLRLSLALALIAAPLFAGESRAPEPGPGFAGVPAAAIDRAVSDILTPLPADAAVRLTQLLEIKEGVRPLADTPAHRAALILVLGTASQEPTAIAHIASAGLAPETVSRLAETGVSVARAGGQLETLRREIAAAVARESPGELPPETARIASLQDLLRFAREAQSPSALVVADPEDDDLAPAPPPAKGTPASLRRTRWTARVMADTASSENATKELLAASQELSKKELVGLVRDFMDATLAPQNPAPPGSYKDAARQRFGLEAVAMLYSKHGWGETSFQRRLFLELAGILAAKSRSALTPAEWQSIRAAGGSTSPASVSFRALAAAATAVASVVAQRPALALSNPNIQIYLLKAFGTINPTLNANSVLSSSDEDVRAVFNDTTRAATALIAALDAIVKAEPRAFSLEMIRKLESDLGQLAADSKLPPEVRAGALGLLETLERHASPDRELDLVPATLSAQSLVSYQPSKGSARFLFAAAASMVVGAAGGLSGLFGLIPALILALPVPVLLALLWFKKSSAPPQPILPEPADPDYIEALKQVESGELGLSLEEKIAALEKK